MTTAGRRGTIAIVVFAALLAVGAGLGAALAAPAGRPEVEAPAVAMWFARILLVLSLLWVVVGILAARTRLVGRPGAAAARATWLSSTRPWRARESTLGLLPLDRWLIFIVPVAVLIATRMLQTAQLSWTHLVLVIGAWTVFALVLRLAVGRRSPWPVIAAVGGVVVLRCILTLLVLSVSGPAGFAHELWRQPLLRETFVALAFAGFAWAYLAAGWSLRVQGGARFATGAVLAAVGAGLALPALGVALTGVEQALAGWDDGLGLLPYGALAAVGPAPLEALAWWAVAAGVLTCAAGLGVLAAHRTRTAAL